MSVEVDEALWLRVKGRAVSEARPLKAVVANALRMYLASTQDTGSVGAVTGGEPPAAERGVLGPCEGCGANARLQFTSDDVGLCGECFAAVPVTGPRAARPTLKDLTRLVAGKTGAAVGTGRELADGALPEPDPTPHQRHVLHEGDSVHAKAGDVVVLAVDPRESERRRRARQDHLRTHPEDETADSEVDF